MLITGNSGSTIDWGEGAYDETSSSWNTHTYSGAGTWDLRVKGSCTGVSFYINNSLVTSIDSVYQGLDGYNSASAAFHDTSITSVPAALWDNYDVPNFAQAFQGCTSLTTVPAALFDNQTSANNFGKTFQDCTGITASVIDLWNDYPGATSANCFKGCVNASNWASIPSEWGGPLGESSSSSVA